VSVSSREELEEERDFLLSSLRDLARERENGELSERDYQALHADYTARAAVVLRALERGSARATRRGKQAPAPVRTRRPLVITLGVVVLVAALAGGAVVTFSGRRGTGPLTGSALDSAQGRLQQALQLESDGKAADALKIYDALIKDDPRNVQALAYRGWLLKRAGLPDQAITALDQAISIDPSFPDAHFFKGMVLYQDRADPAGAVAEFRLFLSNNPPSDMIQPVEDVLKQAMVAAGMPTG
jgi:tetratricopeptide (TPR) repeat protein